MSLKWSHREAIYLYHWCHCIIWSYIENQSCYFIVCHILQYYSVSSPLILSKMALNDCWLLSEVIPIFKTWERNMPLDLKVIPKEQCFDFFFLEQFFKCFESWQYPINTSLGWYPATHIQNAQINQNNSWDEGYIDAIEEVKINNQQVKPKCEGIESGGLEEYQRLIV